MSEEWRDLSLSLSISNYQVSNLGRLKNKSTGYISQAKPRQDGYIRCILVDDNKIRQPKFVHVLIALTFLGEPEDIEMSVDHINKNRSDNRVENLRWATNSEQGKNQNRTNTGRSVYQLSLDDKIIRKWYKIKDIEEQLNINRSNISACCRGKQQTAGGFKWKYTEDVDITDEIWMRIPLDETYEEIYASNLGRIRRRGKESYGTKTDGGYMRIGIYQNGERKKAMVHRLICLAFNGFPPDGKDQVNHIDGNKTNNSSNNLEWISNKENSIHAVSTGLRRDVGAQKRCKPVYQLDLEGNIVSEFDSILIASEFTKISDANICMVCKGSRRTAGGFKWKYKQL